MDNVESSYFCFSKRTFYGFSLYSRLIPDSNKINMSMRLCSPGNSTSENSVSYLHTAATDAAPRTLIAWGFGIW